MPHFMIVLIPYINFIKPFLDKKNIYFQEYGAFKIMCLAKKIKNTGTNLKTHTLSKMSYRPKTVTISWKLEYF